MNDLAGSSRAYFADLSSALNGIPGQDIVEAGRLIEATFNAGRTVFVIGNGGSAATAAHMLCDLGKTTLGKAHHTTPKRIKVIALTDNVPVMTAWGNDVGFAEIFAQQLRNLGEAGDLLIAISASGNSPNILKCLEAATDLGVGKLGLLGFDGGKAAALCDHAIVVRSNDFGIVEDAHCALNHVLTAHLKAVVQNYGDSA